MQSDMIVREADQPDRGATEPSKKKPEPYSFGYRMTDVERGRFYQFRHPILLKWKHSLKSDDLKKFSIQANRSMVPMKSIQDSSNQLAKGNLSRCQINQIKRRRESDFLAALSATEEQSQTLMEKISDEIFVEAQDQKIKIMSYRPEAQDNRRNRTIQFHSVQGKIVLQPGLGQNQQHLLKQNDKEKDVKWILQQIEHEDKSSYHSVFHSFKTDSKKLLEQFGELGWDQRQKLYYFFEKATWSKDLVDYVKIWYRFLKKEMTLETPVVFMKYQVEKKNFNFDKAMKEIAKIADRNKDYPEGWDCEKYGFMFNGKKQQIFEAFKKCTREERNNIKKFFKDVSYESAFYFQIRDFYSKYRKELDAIVVNQPIQEFVKFEKSQMEKGMAMLRKKLLSLQNCRSGKDFMNFSLENYKYDNYLNKAFESLTAEDKKIVLKQIRRVQQLKDSINIYSYGWFDDYRCSFEKIEKEKGILETIKSYLNWRKKKVKEDEEDEIPLNINEMSGQICSRALEPLDAQIPNAQETFEEQKSKSQNKEMQWRKRLKEQLSANNKKPKEKQDHEMILKKVPKKKSGERNKKQEERMEREH